MLESIMSLEVLLSDSSNNARCRVVRDDNGAYLAAKVRWNATCDTHHLSNARGEYTANVAGTSEITLKANDNGDIAVRNIHSGAFLSGWSVASRRYIVRKPTFKDDARTIIGEEEVNTNSRIIRGRVSIFDDRANTFRTMWDVVGDIADIVAATADFHYTALRIYYYILKSIKCVPDPVDHPKQSSPYAVHSKFCTLYMEGAGKAIVPAVPMSEAVKAEFKEEASIGYTPIGKIYSMARVDMEDDVVYTLVYRNGDARAVITFSFRNSKRKAGVKAHNANFIYITSILCSQNDFGICEKALSEVNRIGFFARIKYMFLEAELSFQIGPGSNSQTESMEMVLGKCKGGDGGPFTYSRMGFGWIKDALPEIDVKRGSVTMYKTITSI